MVSKHKEELVKLLKELPDDASLDKIGDTYFNYAKLQLDYRPWRSPIGRWVFSFGIILAVFSMIVCMFSRSEPFVICTYSVWTLFPPSFTLYEYVWLFPDKYKLNTNQLTDMKYTHELAGKIWAAVLIVMGVLILVKFHIKP